jgi:hypothetical protein
MNWRKSPLRKRRIYSSVNSSSGKTAENFRFSLTEIFRWMKLPPFPLRTPPHHQSVDKFNCLQIESRSFIPICLGVPTSRDDVTSMFSVNFRSNKLEIFF